MDSYQLLLSSSDYDAYKTEYIGQSARQVQGQLEARKHVLPGRFFSLLSTLQFKKLVLTLPKVIKCLLCADVVLRALVSNKIKVPAPLSPFFQSLKQTQKRWVLSLFYG